MKPGTFIKNNKYPLILAILTLAFFWKAVLSPYSVFYSPFSDLTAQDFFWRHLTYDSFQKFGELPLWNPYTFSGMPFLANHIPKILYPTNLLFLFFSPVEYLYRYIYALHFFLAGLFLYLYAKKIGLDGFSSFIASVVYIFNLRAVGLVYAGITNELPLLAFFPLALYLFECLIRRNRFLYAILMGLSLSLIVFGVHTQYVIYSYLFLFFYFLFRIFVVYRTDKNTALVKRMSLFFAFSVAASMLLSAAQLLPSLEILEYDTRSRGVDYQFAATSSFPPYHLVTAAIPNFFGTLLHNNYWSLFPSWQFAIYVGIFPLVLLFFSFRKKNPFVLFFAAIAALSLAWAFGRYTPFHHFLYNFVPLVSKFRVPSRMLFFYVFSMAVMAGFGVNYLLGIKTKLDNAFLKKVIIFLSIALVVSILAFSGILLFKNSLLEIGNKLLESKYSKSHAELGLRPLDYYKEKVEGSLIEMQEGVLIFAIILSIITFLLFLWFKKRIGVFFFKLLIISILIFDLFYFSVPYTDVKSPDFVYTQNNVPSFLSNDESNFRVLDLANALPQETAIRYDLQQIGGYDAMILGYYREYASDMAGIQFIPSTTIPIKDVKRPRMLDLLNVKYIISDKNLKDDKYELVYNNTVYAYTNNEKKFYSDRLMDDGMFEFSNLQADYVYKNKDAMPRAFTIGEYIAADRNKILGILKSKDFNPRSSVVLEENINKKSSDIKFKEAEISFYSPNRITVDAGMEDAGFLVLSEIWYPGWKAFDNSRETKVYRANYMFRAVYLDKGEHEIEFVFDPLSYKVGLWISLITLFSLGAIMVIFKIKKFKKET